MKRRPRGFTLIELIIVIITIAIIASVIFLAINPAKRLGDASNAIRDQNALELRQGLERLVVDSLTVPNTLSSLVSGTYMLVTTGGDTVGQCSCTSLNQNIDRIDLAGLLNDYLPTLPVDALAEGDDTGYYIQKNANSSLLVGHCYEYSDVVAETPVVELVANSAGPNSPVTATSVTFGSWNLPNNCKINDGVATVANTDDYDYTTIEQEVKIVKADGTIGSQNKASSPPWGTVANPGYTSYGGEADLWGESWTAADIMDPDFGVVIKSGNAVTTTGYLKMTNFSFVIPEGAVIDGIKVEIERWRTVDGEGIVNNIVDHGRITIYYRS